MRSFKNVILLLFISVNLYAGVPTLTINDDTAAATTNTSIIFSFTFSEGVTGFDDTDVSIVNGSYLNNSFIVNSNSNYTLSVIPNPNFEGDVTISVPAGAAVSSDNNLSTAANASQGVDSLVLTPDQIDLNDNNDTAIVGDNITSLTILTLEGTNNSGEDVNITFYDNATNIGTLNGVLAGANWSTQLFLPSSEYSLSITYTDDLGNISDKSPTLTIITDSISPTTPSTPDLVSVDDTGSYDYDDLTNKISVNVIGTNIASETVDINFYKDGNPVGTLSGITSGTQWSKPLTLISNVDNNITVEYVDIAGNLSAISSLLTIITDTIAPSAPNQPILSNDLNSDNLIPDSFPSVDLNNSTSETLKFDLYDGTTFIGTSSVASYSVSTLTSTTELLDGIHSLTLKVTDLAGNESASSTSLIITVDTQASIVLNEISDYYISSFELNTDLSLSGSVTNVEDGRTVNITNDFNGNTYQTTVSSGLFSFNIPSADWNSSVDGYYYIYVNVTDLAGNYVTDTKEVKIDTSAYINIDNISDSIVDSVERTQDLIVVGSTDFEDGLPVSILLNGIEYSSTANGGSFSIIIPSNIISDLNDTTYTIYTKAGLEDTAGNIAPVTSKIFGVDYYSDSYEKAGVIEPSSTTSTNLSHLGTDIDWFRLDVVERGVLDIASSDINVSVSLHWFGGDVYLDENDESLSKIVGPGSYLIKVDAIDNNQSLDYDLTTSFTAFEQELDENAKLLMPVVNTIDTLITAGTDLNMTLVSKYLYYSSATDFKRVDMSESLSDNISNTSVGLTEQESIPNIEKTTSHTSNTILYDYSIVNSYVEIKESGVTKATLVHQADDFSIYKDRLYTVSEVDGLSVYDISNDLFVKVLANNDVNGSQILVNDKYAYIVNTLGSISIVDIHNDYSQTPSLDVLDNSIVSLESNISLNNYAGEVDVDVFKIITQKEGILTFTSSNVAIGNDLNITVSSDANFSTTLLATTPFNNIDKSVSVNAGLHYVKIQGNSNLVEGKYNLLTEFISSDLLIDKVLNYQSSINDINISTSIIATNGNLESDSDVDLYKFYIPYNGIFELNSTKTVSLVSYEVNASNDFASEQAVTPGYLDSGIYYAKISGLSGSYTISTKFTKDLADKNYIAAKEFATVIDDNETDLTKVISFNLSQNSGELNLVVDDGNLSTADTNTSMMLYDLNSNQLLEIKTDLGIKSEFIAYQRYKNNIYSVVKQNLIYKLLVINISDDFSNSRVLSELELVDGSEGEYRFDFSGDTLTLSSEINIFTINIADKYNPVLDSSIDSVLENSIIVNGTEYKTNSLGFSINDTKNISIGGVEATSIVAIEEFLYVGTTSNGIFAYNIQDPLNPIFIRTITIAREIVKLDVFGTKLYVLSTSSVDAQASKVEIIDILNDYSDYKVGSATIYNAEDVNGTLQKTDIDYFNIQLNSTGDFSVSIDSPDVNCTLSDANDSNMYDCNQIIPELSSGIYYIMLENYDSSKITQYTINPSLTYDDHLDTLNFDSNSPHDIVQSNAAVSGNILTSSDVDYFKILISENSVLDINITAGYETKLFFNGGDELSINPDNTYSISIPGTYFIKISSSTPGDYIYSLTLQPDTGVTFIDKAIASNKLLSTFATNADITAMKSLGNHLYISNVQDGFIIADVSDINNVEIVGRYDTYGEVKNFKIDGTYVYLAEGEAGIEIIDISDKSNIRLIGSFDTDGIANDIVVDSLNSKLYVADGAYDLLKLDITNPVQPSFVFSLADATSDATDLEINSQNIYLADATNGLEEYAFDGELINTIALTNIQKISLVGEKLYVLTLTKLAIYDISTANSISLLGEYSGFENLVSDMKIIDDYAYIVNDVNIEILNIAEPSNIFEDSTRDEVVSFVDASINNLFYAKADSIEILESSPDYSDTFLEAQLLDIFPVVEQGAISKTRSDDKDVFVFNTDKTGLFSITSDLLTFDINVSIYKSTSSGMEVAISQADVEDIDWNSIVPVANVVGNNNDGFSISNLTLNSGAYYVVIQDSTLSGGYYQFEADFNVSNDKYFDTQDSIVESVSVSGGSISDSLFSGGGDIDFVEIFVDERSTVTFENVGDITPRITLYYLDETQIISSLDTNETNETRFSIDMNPGSYRVKIDAFDGGDIDGDYEILLTSKLVEDLINSNGLSKLNIEGIVDVKYLGNYIYVLRQNTLQKYTHLLVEKANFSVDYIVDNITAQNNTNNKLFVYNGNQDEILNYITTTTLAGLEPIVSEIAYDTLSSANEEVLSTTNYNNENIAANILPYLEVKYISQNRILYMYDGATLQVRSVDTDDNTLMRSYSLEGMSNIEVISTSQSSDTVYALSQSAGYMDILTVDTATMDINTSSHIQIGEDIGAMYVDTKGKKVYLGADNKLLVYDVGDISSPVFIYEYDFSNEEYKGTPSSIYKRDERVYLILPSTGIVVLDDKDSSLSVATTILNLGKDIDNVFSMDHRTLNYTLEENTSKRLMIYFFEDTFLDGESDSVYSAGKDGVTPQEGCFIATAAYGSYFEKHVKVLRDFRDNILLTNSLGKRFVHTYYNYSPSVAGFIADNTIAKALVRVVLTPIVYTIKYPLYLLMGLIILLIARKEYNKKRGVIVK